MAVQESRLIISIDARNAERTARALNSELRGITNNGNRATSQTNALGASMQSLAGYMAGVVTVGSAISKMDAYTGLQNRLKLVTDSQVELNTAMNDTFAIAQKTASSWDSVAMVYQRFADNADRLGISMKQTAALTETVSKAISVSGGSAASAEAALMQFGQALASGVLRGEEFNSIAEQAPGLLKAIAFGLNTNVGSLRAMAAEGKITGDALVEALSKAQPYIDDLFNKTDFTIAQSFTQLSNEITKFVGEAGKGSGAAAGLSAAISGLAENLGTIANIAVVGGVALLTKTIIAQTVAVYGSIKASAARRAADLAALESQVQLAGLEVQRTRQVAALAITEVHLARQELNSATTRQARAAATMRLTQAEIALAIAEKQKTAATIADTAAQNANNAARSRGAAIFAAMGGPIGAITIGVGALAAGYMYLQNRTAEANAKLEEQGKIANKTNEELKKLAGNDKVSAVNDLTAAFNSQNEALSKSKEAVDAVLFAIRASSVENERARKITEDARNGVISYTDAIKLLNNEKIPVDLYNRLKEQADQYDENSNKAANTQRALAALKVEVDLAGNAMQNAANKALNKADAMGQDASATRDAAQANREYFDSLNQDVLSANERLAYMNIGFSKEVIDQINKLQKSKQKALGDGVTAIVTTEEINKIVQAQKALDAVKNKENEIAQARREQGKARSSSARSQAKEQRAAVKDAERAAQERLQIEYQYADDLKKGYLDLDAEIKRIIESGADSSFIQKAKDRHNFEEELYLRSLTEQINAYKWSEEEKLKYSIETQKLIANESGKYNDDIKKVVLDSLDAQRDYELAQIKLAKETRIFQAQQAMYSEIGLIQKRYELEQRKIIETAGIADDERRKLLDALNADMKQQEAEKTISVMMNYKNAIGIDTSADSAFIERQKAINAALENGLIKQKEYEAASLASRQQYDRDMQSSALGSLNTLLSATSSTWSSMTQLVKDGAGEQSGAYKAMFLVQQAFAMTSATINALMAYNQVLASPWTFDPISKQVAANITLGMGMASVGMIASQTIAGFKSGGYTGNYGTNQVAGVVHGQEYVLNAEATKRVGKGTLDALNSGASIGDEININVILNISNDGSSTTQVNGQAAKEKELASVIANAVRAIIIKEKRQGGLLS